MQCETISCEGFVQCPIQPNCPIARCDVLYRPPKVIPPVTNSDALNLFNTASGVKTTMGEVLGDQYMFLPFAQTTALETADRFYFYRLGMTMRFDEDLHENIEKFSLFGDAEQVNMGSTHYCLIAYQDRNTFIWYALTTKMEDIFPGTDVPDDTTARPGMKAVRLFNNGQPTMDFNVLNAEFAYNIYNIFNPEDKSALKYGQVIAIQSYDCGRGDRDASGFMIKNIQPLNNSGQFCVGELQPPILAYPRSSIRFVPGIYIGSGSDTSADPFCENNSCFTGCNLAYFQVTESNGCLPPLNKEPNTEAATNFWYAVGFIIAITIAIVLTWIIVAMFFREKERKTTLRFS